MYVHIFQHMLGVSECIYVWMYISELTMGMYMCICMGTTSIKCRCSDKSGPQHKKLCHTV